MQAQNTERRYTYEDYLSWDGEQRWELIDGIRYAMAPAPLRRHQDVLVNLLTAIRIYLRGKSCKVYAAPFDVQLTADDTVVQPDISVICDASKFTDRGCKGAPDMVVEILSPSSEVLDLGIKLIKYLEAGVREYWAIDPKERKLFVFMGKDALTLPAMYGDKAKVRISVLDDCVIDLADVFPPEEVRILPDP